MCIIAKLWLTSLVILLSSLLGCTPRTIDTHILDFGSCTSSHAPLPAFAVCRLVPRPPSSAPERDAPQQDGPFPEPAPVRLASVPHAPHTPPRSLVAVTVLYIGDGSTLEIYDLARPEVGLRLTCLGPSRPEAYTRCAQLQACLHEDPTRACFDETARVEGMHWGSRP